MKYTLVSYFDVEIEKFNPIFCVPGTLEDTTEQIKDSGRKHLIQGQDTFKAYFMGSFDTANGQISLIDKPQEIVDLTAYVRETK